MQSHQRWVRARAKVSGRELEPELVRERELALVQVQVLERVLAREQASELGQVPGWGWRPVLAKLRGRHCRRRRSSPGQRWRQRGCGRGCGSWFNSVV